MFKLKIAAVFTALALMFILIPGSSVLAKEDSKITYDFIECPVTVDGKLYVAEQMSYFDGKILHFIYSKTGELYAFKSMSDLEKYMFEEYGHVWGEAAGSKDIDPGYNYYYVDWFYGGNCLCIPFGGVCNDLSAVQPSFDNCISSAITQAWSTLYLNYNCTGSSLTIAPNNWWIIATFQDLASSIEVDWS
ncbi:MAG: hypothetical protein PHF74_06340 [Dehalococcoidales bacterium]|nr:hypothetical protein [Dehalococcoidales bacterium]